MNYSNYGESGARLLQMGDPGSSQLREGDMVADRELALTKDNRVVEERDKDALFLLVAKGQVLTREKAAEHGLRSEGGRLAWGSARVEVPVEEPEAEAEAPADDAEPDASDYSGLTKAEMQAKLTERGIEFKERDTKDALIALLAAE